MAGARHGATGVVCISSAAFNAEEKRRENSDIDIPYHSIYLAINDYFYHVGKSTYLFLIRIKHLPMIGESPTLPNILFLMPPVDVAHATLPARSTATAPTVS